MKERIIVIVGSEARRYALARRLTEQNIYCEAFADPAADQISALNPAGIIAAGAGIKKGVLPAGVPTVTAADADLDAFLYSDCGLSKSADFSDFVSAALAAVKSRLNGKKTLCALSGGVDSAVTAALIHKANPDGLTCVFVDHGLLRKGEAEEVMRVFKGERGMNVIKIAAADRYLDKLKGIEEPNQKRKIIGEEFIRIFEEEAKKLGKVQFLAQGTIYPDILESIHGVKPHHNVGGLPSVVDFDELCEPLQFLFKDEVRKLGAALGLPEPVIMRQPFPGPGLGVRVLGEVTREKLAVIREADSIYREEIALAGLDKTIWQYFVALPGFRSVGVTDNKRTYGYTVILRAVHTKDAMTASIARIPYECLEKISARITAEVKDVNRVVYDITNKPPATIEWE